MKIKRLCAASIRDAMRKVREELGPDAVILSNERTSAGFEIVAAVDYDEKLLQEVQQSAATEAATQRRVQPREHSAATTTPAVSEELTKSAIAAYEAAARESDGSVAAHTAPVNINPTEREAPEPPARNSAAEKAKVLWSQDPLLVEMRQEIRTMHHLLERQLSGFAWGELSRRQPYRADLIAQLMDFGFSPSVCLKLADAVIAEKKPAVAWNAALQVLSQGLSTTDDDILTEGGVAALIGPTGVGKTTTVAKLAALYNLRHGMGHVALITTDSYRIGAYEQLSTFGMIMDTPVRMASNARELQDAIDGFSKKSLILIDTAGMSQRDVRLSQQFALLNCSPQVRSYLVMAANAQLSVLQETMTAFSQAPLQGSILTKVDETTRLGAVLSALYEKGLPMAYISNGQRVPEDLQAADVEAVIRMGEAFSGLYSDAPFSDILALTFGKRLAEHAIC